MLTISKLKRWSINYYIDTAQAGSTLRGIWRGGRRIGGVDGLDQVITPN